MIWSRMGTMGLVLGGLLGLPGLGALEKPAITYSVFQFPTDQIPRIDGQVDDWDLVPEGYVVSGAELRPHHAAAAEGAVAVEPPNVRVRVGWVKGLNRLYFLYEAEDDHWEFDDAGLRNDTFEIMVDGDASGGPLIDAADRARWDPALVGRPDAAIDPRIGVAAAHWAGHGVQAQNYHIFTPAVAKDWAMAWGSATWIKDFPWANAAQSFAFKSGEAGRFTLEFWVTPFDYAGPEGPARAVETELREEAIIGLSWILIDYDGPAPRGFWTLSPERTSFGHASQLCAFRLMPMETTLRPALDARWSWQVVDMDRRLVAFRDESVGEVTAWHWEFGDGHTSDQPHPQHTYAAPGNYVVILEVRGPAGVSRRSKVWDVQLAR